MIVRKATEKDSEHIATIAITTWVDTYALEGMNSSYSRYIMNRFTPENIALQIQQCTVLVAETEFGLCGYAVVSQSDSNKNELETIYILPKFQNQGIGKLFIEVIKSEINGVIWLKCADDNPQALAFYRSCGFIENGVTWFELDGQKYRCLLFEYATSAIPAL